LKDFKIFMKKWNISSCISSRDPCSWLDSGHLQTGKNHIITPLLKSVENLYELCFVVVWPIHIIRDQAFEAIKQRLYNSPNHASNIS